VWSIGTPVAKGELYRWLKLEWPTDEALADGAAYPPGTCHFPQYGEEYFKQLTAERLVTRIVKGFPRTSWEKEPGRRNEALDCRVYARAAAAICGIDRWSEAHWRELERCLGRQEEAVLTVAGPSTEPEPARSPRPPARHWLLDRREDWLGRSRHGPWLER
jgi:phage terminase large subunit GpA-like protein